MTIFRRHLYFRRIATRQCIFVSYDTKCTVASRRDGSINGALGIILCRELITSEALKNRLDHVSGKMLFLLTCKSRIEVLSKFAIYRVKNRVYTRFGTHEVRK